MKVACYVSSGGSGRNEAETIGKLELKKGRIPSQRRSTQTFILSSSVILATVSRLKREPVKIWIFGRELCLWKVHARTESEPNLFRPRKLCLFVCLFGLARLKKRIFKRHQHTFFPFFFKIIGQRPVHVLLDVQVEPCQRRHSFQFRSRHMSAKTLELVAYRLDVPTFRVA